MALSTYDEPPNQHWLFTPPAPPDGVALRRVVLERLSSPSVRVGVVIAPAGYGKTSHAAAIVAQETVYRFDQLKSKKDEVRRPLRKLTFAVERRNELTPAEEALNQGLAIAEGMALAKNLGNLPGNLCTPTYLAEQATAMAQEHGLECQILEKAEMEVLKVYLPERMGEAEITAAVQAIVAELGASGPGDMGKVMGAVKAQLAGKADMGLVSAAVKAALTK